MVPLESWMRRVLAALFQQDPFHSDALRFHE